MAEWPFTFQSYQTVLEGRFSDEVECCPDDLSCQPGDLTLKSFFLNQYQRN